MIFTLHHINSVLRLTAFNLIGIFLLVITLCLVFPFFLVIVIIGTASAGAYALASRWQERRGRYRTLMKRRTNRRQRREHS